MALPMMAVRAREAVSNFFISKWSCEQAQR
jgi:hypothetical protein